MTGGIAKVVIFSFTERGTKQNRYIYRKLKMQGYICEGYAPAKYVMGEEGGVKQLPKKKEDLIRERWGKWAFLFIGAAGIAVRYIAPYVKDKFTDSAVVVADEAGQCDPFVVRSCGRSGRARGSDSKSARRCQCAYDCYRCEKKVCG